MAPNIERSIANVNRHIYGGAKYALQVRKNETFGERVRKLREAMSPRTSQAKLAKAVGIKQPSLSVIEGGDTKPDTIKANTLSRLAACLGVTPTYLVTGVELPAKPEADPLLTQLGTLYAALDDEKRAELVRHAKFLLSESKAEKADSKPAARHHKETSSA